MKKVAATRGHSVRRIDFFVLLFVFSNEGAAAGITPGCERLEVAVAVANFYGFLLRRLTLTTASPLTFLYAAPRVDSDSWALSAKLVRMCEITGNSQRCKNIFEFFCQGGRVRPRKLFTTGKDLDHRGHRGRQRRP